MLSKLRDFVERYSDEIFLVFIILTISLISFILGGMSTGNNFSGDLILESTPIETGELLEKLQKKTPPAGQGSATPTSIVGNKSSKIYHRSDCVGARTMSEGNKIYFTSIVEAKNAGYRPAGNCPGLD